MHRELILTESPINEPAWVASRARSLTSGAVVTFSGVVRGSEHGSPIAGLEYTAFEAMARHQFGLLLDRVAARWPVESVRLVHRLGRVQAGEVSLWVEVAAPHRAEALAACQMLIDEMKRVVPIWKQVLG
jgi:molybdopterin synthase catalytic subunit